MANSGNYYMYFDDTLIPVLPKSLDVKNTNNSKTLTLINEGEVSILKKEGLKAYSFSLLLPNNKYSWVKGFAVNKANYYIEKFTELKINQKPFQYMLIRMKPDGTMLGNDSSRVYLEDYTITDDHDLMFDREISLTLREYVPFKQKRIEVVKDEAGNETISVVQDVDDVKNIPKMTTVKEPQSLFKLNKLMYGDTKYLSYLAQINSKLPSQMLKAGEMINFGVSSVGKL